MSAPIMAVDVNMRTEWHHQAPELAPALRGLLRDVLHARASRCWVGKVDAEIVRTVTRARTACAVAHYHAQRLGMSEWRLHGAPYVPFCKHHERPEACWPCYVEENP